MASAIKDTAHGLSARALFIDQFRGRKVVTGILDSLTSRVQAVENSIFDVINLRMLDLATFAQLDSVGDLVGEPRLGRADTAYREAIRLRIRVERSQGRAEDVIQVVSLATSNNFLYREMYPAGFQVDTFNIQASYELQRQIGQTRAVGVRGVIMSSNWASSNNFVYGTGYGTVANAKGFGSVYDATVGGKFVSSQNT